GPVGVVCGRPLPTPPLDPLALHDALPIYHLKDEDHDKCATTAPPERHTETAGQSTSAPVRHHCATTERHSGAVSAPVRPPKGGRDRKSTRLNSSHVKSSYAVFCLKKKNNR